MRDDFWNSWLHFAYLFCFKVWPMCIYNGYSIPPSRRLGNVKSWANWDVIKWLKAIRHFLKGTLALSSWKYYLLAWRWASHWEGSMSLHNTYAQIVLATKKIIPWFYFSFFFHIYALTLTTLWNEALDYMLAKGTDFSCIRYTWNRK